jgi:hypothetical protein
MFRTHLVFIFGGGGGGHTFTDYTQSQYGNRCLSLLWLYVISECVTPLKMNTEFETCTGAFMIVLVLMSAWVGL